jgi:hypothetical protein
VKRLCFYEAQNSVPRNRPNTFELPHVLQSYSFCFYKSGSERMSLYIFLHPWHERPRAFSKGLCTNAQQQMVIPKRDDEAPKERTKQHICGRLVYNDRELHGFVQMLTNRYLRFGKKLYLFDERNIFKMYRVSTHMQVFRYR